MPELPEVETIKNDLKAAIVGLTIQSIDIYDTRVLKTNSKPAFIRFLLNKTVADVMRRGKVVIIAFKGGGFLLAHPKMTGQLIIGEHQRNAFGLKDTKAVLGLSSGKFLNYNDQRMFGRLSYVEKLTDDKLLNTIGPEPFESGFTADWIAQRARRHTIPIKQLLLDQHFVAGIGNIYASEILFGAGILPTKQAKRLKQSEINALHASTIRVLKEAVHYRGTSMRNYRDSAGQKGQFMNRIKVYDKKGQPCPACKDTIKRIIQNGRSTFYCRRCQH